MSERHRAASAEETEAVAVRLARRVGGGDLILLEGDLAAGKTCFVRGLVRGLGGDAGEVSSPSFVLVQSYPCAGGAVQALHHVDLYRIGEETAELREIGLEELLSDAGAVTAVEWPAAALPTWLPAGSRLIRVKIIVDRDDAREISIEVVPAR